MPGAEYKPVPALPGGVCGIMLHLLPDSLRHRSGTYRQAGMTALGLFDGVRSQEPYAFYSHGVDSIHVSYPFFISCNNKHRIDTHKKVHSIYLLLYYTLIHSFCEGELPLYFTQKAAPKAALCLFLFSLQWFL